MHTLRNMLAFFKEYWLLISCVAVITFVVSFGTVGMEKYVSSTGFCLSCHSMKYVNHELKESSHFGALGINPECQDCHIPPEFFSRIETHLIDGLRGMISEKRYDYSTKEKFDERRAEMAHHARVNLRKWDSSPCRSCHKRVMPSSEEAELEHKKMQTGDFTCIDCHQNLVHEAVPEEDIKAGIEAGEIILKDVEEEEEIEGADDDW